jgi:hypothetical protein
MPDDPRAPLFLKDTSSVDPVQNEICTQCSECTSNFICCVMDEPVTPQQRCEGIVNRSGIVCVILGLITLLTYYVVYKQNVHTKT